MIERKDYLKKIKNFIDTDLIKVLTGMRQCGKTTMLKLIIKELRNNRHIPEENIFFISFESTKYKWIDNPQELDKNIYNLTENINDKKRKANPEKILNYIKILNEKYYLMDHGFYKALIGDNDYNEGQKIENIVYNELLRRDYEITVGIYGDLEIDFVCKKNN